MVTDPDEEEKIDPVAEDMRERFGPEAKDTIEKSKQSPKTLAEKDFIHDELKTNPSPALLWILLLSFAVVVLWGARSWYLEFIGQHIASDPFLKVTNRDFSLFLWQNPEFMRANQQNKSGYLPAFQYMGSVNMNPSLADKYVLASPEAIFRYHIWERLLKEEFSPTSIPLDQFKEFLADAAEWDPKNWVEAPKDYVAFVQGLGEASNVKGDISLDQHLPTSVKMAFQGWKNYYKDGEAINQENPTYSAMKGFLEKHPHFARNYWQNILDTDHSEYLKTLSDGRGDPAAKIPNNELAPFLKAAFFNSKK